MSAHFELGRIPRRVLVSRASDVTPRCFIRCHVTVDVEWQLDWGSSARVVRRYMTSDHLHFRNSWRSCQSTSALNTIWLKGCGSGADHLFRFKTLQKMETEQTFNGIQRDLMYLVSGWVSRGVALCLALTVTLMVLLPYLTSVSTAANRGPDAMILAFSNLSCCTFSR